jgi:hypothetical protein
MPCIHRVLFFVIAGAPMRKRRVLQPPLRQLCVELPPVLPVVVLLDVPALAPDSDYCRPA